MDLIPNKSNINEIEDRLIVDGANGVGGEKLEVIKKNLNGLVIEVLNSGKEGGVLNEGVGADFVQKEKVVPHGFGSNHAGIRSATPYHLIGEPIFIFVVRQGPPFFKSFSHA